MAKKKTVTLPFVVAPRREPIMHTVGNKEAGEFEIERRGYLTVAEKAFMQQATAGDDTITGLHRLAGRISREKGVQASEVVDILSKGRLDDPLLEGYDDEIDNLVAAMTTFEDRRKVVAASCLIYFRVNRDWEIEQTMELHPDLIDDLYLLFLMEDAKSFEGFEKNEEAADPEGK